MIKVNNDNFEVFNNKGEKVITVDNLQIHYEKDKRIAEMYDLYKLYCGMSLSMQKAVKDIMIVANGGEIEE